MSNTTTAEASGGGYNFGAFKGVFTPSLLTILGVIMYLRFGWVLGNVGLWQTLLIVTMATSITFLTALSMSALATNMKVGGGGAYFIISRSLGLEAGAAVGLPLYFAQALGISFYVSGFAESLIDVLVRANPTWLSPQMLAMIEDGSMMKVIGVVTLIVLAGIVWASADLALKAQFVVMALILGSLVSFFLGSAPTAEPPPPEIVPESLGFMAVFAVFFPAVTGIEAGIAMSGDLKDPAKSLPKGTIAAVLVGYAVYMAIPVYLMHTLDNPERLKTNMMIMRDVAAIGGLIVIGVWAASISSAMGSLLGAPRTLQALAVDRVIPRILGKGFGPTNDPRLATLVSFGVALAGVLLGDLNAIAGLLSMFFLTSYGLLNFSAGMEELIGPPSWRPKFRVPWWVSLFGSFACFATMFMINAGVTFLAMFVAATVFWVVKRRSLQATWGDMRSGIFMLLVRMGVHALEDNRPDERTWRPNLMVLSGSPTTRWHLIELASAISQARGFLTVAAVVPESTKVERLDAMRKTIRNYLVKRGVSGLTKVYPAESPLSGMQELVRTYGFGPIEPNTILLGDTQERENYDDYATLIMLVQRRRQNLVIIRENEDVPQFVEGQRIDVWITENPKNRGLMLALAVLLCRDPGWRNSTLCLKTIITEESQREQGMANLEGFIERSRLDAVPEIVPKLESGVFDTIAKGSEGADLVFLGIRSPEPEETVEAYTKYYAHLLQLTNALPPTALVMAAEDLDFSAIFEQ